MYCATLRLYQKDGILMRLFILFWRRLGGVKDGFCFFVQFSFENSGGNST